jgi:tetratricopeptide (TPR) repeat protein/predicted Ser/Thr protein kinase
MLGAPEVIAAANAGVLPEPGQEPYNAFPKACNSNLPAVPGYEIVSELGRGGMGVVYQAQQVSLKRFVALKMILAGPHADSAARIRFHIEAEAVARLQHPNIVQIYEVGEYGGKPFLSLEYINGGSLMENMAGTGQPERPAALIAEKLARAVHYMHMRGILHRDLKPTNVLLTDDGIPKITDFGLARILDADSGPTRSETWLGTPSYMAPEQAAGDSKRVGATADVYSLGAILYELLTGRAPFQGATPLSILDQLRNREPMPPRRLRRAVSLDLETICLKCLQKDPSKRYASAEALADDLCRFLARQPIRARPIPLCQRLWRHGRRRLAPFAWALAALGLVGLLLSLWLYSSVAGPAARHRAGQIYQEFVRYRNEAFVHGLLAPDEGTLFLGADAAANLQTAEASARKALALAGIDTESEPTTPVKWLGPGKTTVQADCYALVLVLASVREQQALVGQGSKGRYEEALRILDHAPQLGLRTRAYHLRRAHLLAKLGNQKQAKIDSDRAAAVAPDGALDQFLVGEEHYRRGDWQNAMNSFNCALGLQPDYFWAQFFLAVCHLKTRHWEAAKAGLNACLAQQPDFVWAYVFRSFANEKLQQPALAEADFRKALARNPNAGACYVLFLTRGMLHFNHGEMKRAAADFRSALAIKPEQYHACMNLAHVYLAEGRFEEAASQVRVALQFRPPPEILAGYHCARSGKLLQDNKYEDALQACEAALQLSPSEPLPYMVRGRSLLALGRAEQAERSFDQYLQNGGEETSDIFKGRGLARMRLEKYPEAVEDYTRALERAPDADIYEHRGWAHFCCDAWKLALRDFSEAITLDPGPVDRYIGRGLARVMLGDYQKAIADADSSWRRQPDAPEMMHNIACIFAQAVARVEADLQQADRHSLAAGWRRRALEALHQTRALLRPAVRSAFWRDKIAPDTALAPLHNDPAFQQLQNAYGE